MRGFRLATFHYQEVIDLRYFSLPLIMASICSPLSWKFRSRDPDRMRNGAVIRILNPQVMFTPLCGTAIVDIGISRQLFWFREQKEDRGDSSLIE